MALNDYVQTLQGFVRDRGQKFLNYEDAVRYTNRARRELAMRTQCIRLIPPISGAITAITVTAPGNGYTNPTVTISTPDTPSGTSLNPAGARAIATAMVIGGHITSISVSYGGSGYFQPTVTISDPTGTGAAAVAVTEPLNITQGSQEVYAFSDIPIQANPGVRSVYAIRNISLIYSNLRYELLFYPLTIYKGMIAQYPQQYRFVPSIWTQEQQGASGTIRMYPIPSQQYQWEPDCQCLPNDLIDDQSPEAIPEPFSEAVPFLAAAFAYQEFQNFNSSRYYQDLYTDWVHRYAGYARISRQNNIYGRW
jgi:hypothetical protein